MGLHRGVKRVFELISHEVFLESFSRIQIPHKSVDLSFTITSIKNELMDLCGNQLLHNDDINTFCEIRVHRVVGGVGSPLGPPYDPRNSPTAGLQEGGVSDERGTPACVARWPDSS